MKKRPIVLCIMDGYGLTDRVDGNAVKLANTPNLDDLMAMYPTTTIKACGNAVGLPEGQMELRSWSYEYWCRTYCLSVTYFNQ